MIEFSIASEAKPRLTFDFFTPTAWHARSSTPSSSRHDTPRTIFVRALRGRTLQPLVSFQQHLAAIVEVARSRRVDRHLLAAEDQQSSRRTKPRRLAIRRPSLSLAAPLSEFVFQETPRDAQSRFSREPSTACTNKSCNPATHIDSGNHRSTCTNDTRRASPDNECAA